MAARVHRGVGELHPRRPRFLASHFDSRLLGVRRAARRARRKSDGACFPAWLDRWGGGRFTLGHTPHAGSNYRPPLSTKQFGRLRQPIKYREVDETPHTGHMPVAQPSPARHPRTAAQFLRQHLPRDACAEDKENAGQACAIRDTRPSAATAIARPDYPAFGRCSSAVRRRRFVMRSKNSQPGVESFIEGVRQPRRKREPSQSRLLPLPRTSRVR